MSGFIEIHIVTLFIEFHIVTLYRDSKLRQEAEAALEAPAEDSSFVEDDWGSDGGEEAWADDGGDWKRKKRSSVEEAPSERWTRETHEVKIMENLTAGCSLQRKWRGGRVFFKDVSTFRNQLLTYPVLTYVPWTMMQTHMKRSSSIITHLQTYLVPTGWLCGLQVQLGCIQRQECDAAEAQEDPPWHGRPVQERVDGGV